ncbi:MAG: methanogenesis marker 17 protein [Methanosphaera sp.]|uniref:methanogenesis marker 17 protein n=1 Tax=Methanosphaera sp. TaxID=2666342 RepID=UPI0025F32088|nr:methanogenesis marker 17 protein [Methanosphaera sp.]MCI5867119.1 methanogenesis marker 17 protein [Methanosphaera sp.]MDD6534812.1 methanogenesis marker 17 protein [Methanosphaera sp.]MDY3955520.1 methanogenesis marker 17 protein [Methanosphaera sp.]
MYVECYDEQGAQAYDTILRYTLQELKLAKAIDDIKVFIEPRDALFMGVVKLAPPSAPIYLKDMASYKVEGDILKIKVEKEDYTPDLLRVLWDLEGRSNVSQPSRYKIEIPYPSFDPDELMIINSHEELKRKVYDALFRIVPEGFRITYNASEGNMVCLMCSDQIIDDSWYEKFDELIDEVKNRK